MSRRSFVETDGQHQSSASFVDHVRGLGLTAPVVLVVPEHAGAPLLELKAGADDYVVNNQSLVADLPRVLTRALERTRAGPHPTKAPLRLLYVGDATACPQVSRESSVVDCDHRGDPRIERCPSRALAWPSTSSWSSTTILR